MDRRFLRSSSCNSSGKNPAPSSPAAVSRSVSSGGIGNKDVDAASERAALLPRQLPGGMARKGRKGPKRRVQWKDKHGSRLTDVREFQPSDSSDSDDEYLDTCICSIISSCIQKFIPTDSGCPLDARKRI